VSTPPREPTEAELRQMQEAYEAELARITTSDVIIQTAVTLINLAGRRLGLEPGREGERDLEQVRDAIDAVRGMMDVLERIAPQDIGQLRAALSQLQMAYAAQASGAAPPAEPAAETPADAAPGPSAEPGAAAPAEPAAAPGAKAPEGEEKQPGPAEASGRLWVPGH
jgi:hypothetical protein